MMLLVWFAFQMALAAWTTGTFSFSQAGTSLALSIFGGFVVGFVTAMVNRFLRLPFAECTSDRYSQ